MRGHFLPVEEILQFPAGRVLDTLVEEYVVGLFPSIWSRARQKFEPCGWFETADRMIAEQEDGPVCRNVPMYSQKEWGAMKLMEFLRNEGIAVEISRSEPVPGEPWVRVRVTDPRTRQQGEGAARSFPLALARAALCAGRSQP